MAEEPLLNNTQKSDTAIREEEILKFWQDNKIFEKTLSKESPKGNYVFYDGPPFATGLPHHGHILGSTIKDAVPRYFTMKGYHVDRRWGWDTHGLPIENIVEKELGISGKKEIEKIGVAKFNSTARSKVLEYVHAWKNTVERIARWVDFDGAYLTMSNDYIDSVWWTLKEIDKKGLLYEGERVLPYCPRCETPIANSEIAMDNSYKDITDISITAKFELVDEPGTFVLGWTTTPWTLPGNVALAVNREIEYIKVEKDGSKYIVAKELSAKVFKEELSGEVVNADELIGKSYKPVFDYYKDVELKNKENIWKIWNANYVTTEQGTGVVHIAPAYGEEDMALAKVLNLPIIHHVTMQGTFVDAVTDFAGVKVKPKEDHQATDIEIIKNLAHRGKLFSKEKIIHSYPHCYRCDTPLFYNALSAWFIKIQEVKQRALELNNNINWVPEHLKHGRFEKSMEGAPDWNISRNRYWASPLPFWKSEDGLDVKVIGSLDELKEKTKSTNKYFVMRHGEAESNVRGIANTDNSEVFNLTEKGKGQVLKTIEELKGKGIDLIIASPLTRTQQTAHLVAEGLGLSANDIVTDDRIVEIQSGDFNGKPIADYRAQFKDLSERMTKRLPGGAENVEDVRVRSGDFIYDIDKKYSDKNILIVAHEYVVWSLVANVQGLDKEQAVAIKELNDDFIQTGSYIELDFASIPHNEKYELDMHKPYIDEITFSENGKTYKRIPEVIDCWLESAAMPFAARHYPMENKEEFAKNFPAQFVSEYIAQTRTWFYYTHIISTILFDSIPFENIVTTGNVLAEDGSKMSKSKKNFPDPWLIFDKYGVDSLRFYLLSTPVMKSEDLNFSEKGVDEIQKKLVLRLKNIVSFYSMYADNKEQEKEENVLDTWIISRLNQLKKEVTTSMDAYEIDSALRPVLDFVDDLSTWYLRRSRDRFKTNKPKVLKFVLLELSKILAPFTPFISEDVYKTVGGEKESVHLESWPEAENIDTEIISQMQNVRDLVTLALEARSKVNIKVRQPLATLFVKDEALSGKEKLLELVLDEVNVKSVSFDKDLDEKVKLDTTITPELQKEGDLRELIRSIQSLRKDAKLNPSERVTLVASENSKDLVSEFKDELLKIAGIENVVYQDGGENSINLSESTLQISIKK